MTARRPLVVAAGEVRELPTGDLITVGALDLATVELLVNKDVANGYCGLNSSAKVPSGNLTGATSSITGIVRLTGDLGGTATAPTVPGLAAKLDAADASVTNARTPTAHASSHLDGGADEVVGVANGAWPFLTPTATKTSAYTAVSGDLVMCDGSGGAFTVTLPAAAPGRVVGIKRIDAVPSNAVTIAAAGSDTIGAGAVSSGNIRTQEAVLILQANGTNWVFAASYTGNPTGLPTAKGDILAATAPYTLARLGVGANDTVVTADTAQSTGLKYATIASLGAELTLVPTASKTTTYTAADRDLVLCDATSGGFTVTLPAAAAGRKVGIKKTDASANLITISRAGSDTIGAAAATSITLALREQFVTLTANGTNWVITDSSYMLANLDARYANASLLTSGTVAAARLPNVRSPRFTITYGATVTPDCNNGPFQFCTATGAVALAIPTNAVEDFVMSLRFVASGAQRVITFNASFKAATGVGTTLTIPSGGRGDIALRYEAAYGWTILSATVS